MQIFIPNYAKLGSVMVLLVLTFGAFGGAQTALAKPSCPGHPSCGGGDDDGDPPASSNPAIVYNQDLRDLYVMNADGSAPTLLVEGQAGKGKQSRISYQHGSFSPDGSQIAFVDRGNRDGVWVIGTDGTSPPQLIFTEPDITPITDVAWHPTRNWIAFGSDRPYIVDGSNKGDFDVMIVSPETWESYNLTTSFPADPVSVGPGLEHDPTWSPDGSKLMYNNFIDLPDFPNLDQLVLCEFDDSGIPVLNCPLNTDGSIAAWHQAIDIEEATWHPTQDLIAYTESSEIVGGNSTHADLFIESSDRSTTCIHLKADTSPYADTRGNCVVHEIGEFIFRLSVAWSCDGNDLIVTGQSSPTASRSIYVISDVLSPAVSPPTLMRAPEGKARNLQEVESMRICPVNP